METFKKQAVESLVLCSIIGEWWAVDHAFWTAVGWVAILQVNWQQ